MKSIYLLLFGAVLCSLFAAVKPAFAQSLAFTTNTLNVIGGPYCIVAADVNGDGKLDLICANKNVNTLTVESLGSGEGPPAVGGGD